MDLPALPKRRVLLGIVVSFFLLTGAIYWQSLHNGFVRLDDGSLITENPAVRVINGASLKAIFTNYDPELYIPLTFMSYQLDFKLGGADPFIYHLTNLILHTLNALLVAWLFLLLSRGRMGVALIAGLLFAVHPLHTEAVAWASARKDVLSLLFFLLSLIGYIRFRESGVRRTYWLSVLCFALGLLAKVMVITLPLLLLLVDFREKRAMMEKGQWLEKLPFFALAAIFGFIALLGKQELLASSSTLVKFLLAEKSVTLYLGKFLWPAYLSVLYPYVDTVSLFLPAFTVPAVILASLFLFTLWTLRGTRDIAFGMGFFLIALVPTFSNLAKEGDYHLGSDRYAYLPSIGLLWVLLLFATALWDVLMQGRNGKLRKTAGCILTGFLVFVLGIKAHAQSLVWKDTESLFENVLLSYPDSYAAHNNLGNVRRRQGKLDEAVEEFRAALAARPHAMTWSNLGAVLRKQGKIREALEAYRSALSLDPASGEALTGMGLVYAQTGEIEKALEAYGKAIAVRPRYTQPYVNRGSLLLDRGQLDDAIRDFRSAVRVDPLLPEAQYDLGVALQRQGESAEAIGAYEAARSMAPEFTAARLNLGALYYQEGRYGEARREFRAILFFDPDNAAARSALQQMDAAQN